MSAELRPLPAPTRTSRLGNMALLGCHYDIARGAYLQPQALLQLMGLARQAGFNTFLPYLENMIRLEPIARACPSCAYTPAQWRELEEAAAELGMELVPHFNVIGHTQDICRAYPELAAAPGEKEMDPSQPRVAQWLTQCLEEFCSFSRSRHFLIGGDEWQAPRHLLLDPQVDPGRLWVEQVNRAVNLLASRGRVPILWHDMLLHYPHVLPLLSRQAVVAFWYYDQERDLPALSLLKQHGFRTIMAGGCCGIWSRRYLRGLDSAAQSALAHHADGFIATHWEETAFERGMIDLHLLRRWLGGQELPAAVLEAFSLLEALAKTPADVAFVPRWRKRLLDQLDDPAWSDLPPECRAYMLASARDDRTELARLFAQHHYAQGPLLARLQAPAVTVASPSRPAPAPRPASTLELVTHEDPELGPVLRVRDARQTLVVYPKFGAPLQDWWVDDRRLIDHPLADVPRLRHAAPGGYRSFGGGFRPIWALGTHHNPNILWQNAWQWSVLQQDTQHLTLRFTRSMSHVDVTYDLTLTSGRPGFEVELAAVNRLPHAWGGFNFNLPLAPTARDLAEGELRWSANGRAMRRSIEEGGDSAIWVDQAASLTWHSPDWQFHIDAEPAQTSGFYVDWHASFITPDLHARYQPLAVGQTLRTRWSFRVTMPRD